MEMHNVSPSRNQPASNTNNVPRYRPSVAPTPAQIAAAEAARRRSPSTVDGTSLHDQQTHQSSYVSTMHALNNFDPRTSNSVSGGQRQSRIFHDAYLNAKIRNRKLLNQTQRASKARQLTSGQSVIPFILNGFRRPPYPKDEDLADLALSFFPPRMSLKVQVCDIGPNNAKVFQTEVGKLEACWKTKPEWAQVRWIHVPLGNGIVHSSFEDMFIHDWHKGRPFPETGGHGFPYLDLDCLCFYPKSYLRDIRDAYYALKPMKRIRKQLDSKALAGDENENFQQDLEWRAAHLGVPVGYWDLVVSDIPSQLSEGATLDEDGPLMPVKGLKQEIDPSAVRHEQFRHAQLGRSRFRAFHRSDGCVLTMSPGRGIDYVNRDFETYLEESPEALQYNPSVSALATLLRKFEESGTSTWERPTVEYFLIYLFTEIGLTPHNMRDGLNSVSILTALQVTVEDLKRRRYDPWLPHESINLVKDYLICADELKNLNTLAKKKGDFFQRLEEDLLAQNEEDEENGNVAYNPQGESAIRRVKWAINTLERQATDTEKLHADLLQAMNSLFQLRSIEQNELAITADSQNRAIVIFTGVTVVFLPLSFFTSYYGMNLQGIAGTNHDEAYFWKVCGSLSLVIVFVVTICAFWHRLRMRNTAREGLVAWRMVV